MAEIGVGVIGYGLGGRVFHAPFVKAVNGLRLAAILQRKGDEASQAFPEAQIVRSFDELLADAVKLTLQLGHELRAKEVLLPQSVRTFLGTRWFRFVPTRSPWFSAVFSLD